MYTVVIGIKRMIVGGDAANEWQPGHGHRHPRHAAAGAGGAADAEVVRQGPGGDRKIMAGVSVPRTFARPSAPSKVIQGISMDIAGRRVRRHRRALGLRQVDAAAHGGGAGDHHRGRDRHRRARGERPRAEGPRHRHGVPELRALPAHERVRQHGLRPEDPGAAQGGDRAARAARGGDPRARAAARAPAARALRRPAPARRDGARHRARAQGVPVRRAALQPRRQAARADAKRAAGAAPAAEDHHALRDARPGRGDDARAPHDGDERRARRADRRAARGIPETRPPPSSPASSARRR